jgi:glutathione synthase/RimK-type ligase-like ATP-grasp enzyme
MILVSSHRKGTEADRVIRELRRRDADVVRVNTGDRESRISIAYHDAAPHVRILCDDREITLDTVTAAWLHQLPPLDVIGTATDLQAASRRSSRLRAWEAVFLTVPDELWVSPPHLVRRAGNKFVQLLAAGRAGFGVPVTVLGDDAWGIRTATADHDRVVVKYFGDTADLWAVENGYAAVTRRLELGTVSDQQLEHLPLIYQEEVPAEREYRVVVIGEQFFIAACDRVNGEVDIRLVPDALHAYRPASAPEALTKNMRSMLDELGLGFCSADVLETATGDLYFLDLNATGAWWWIDDLYDRALTTAWVDLLTVTENCFKCST